MKTQLIMLKNEEKIRVEEDTQYVLALEGLDSEDPFSLELIFVKEGVTAEILGVFNLNSEQQIKITTITNHQVPHTSCTTDIRMVLNDNSKASYVGKIVIAKPAQQTSSFLNTNTLVIGNSVSNNSQPILEIEADDVKASHGSTTGRIDKLQLYYLQSRGFNTKEAESLIIGGFFESLLSRIIDEDVKEKVKELVSWH